MDEKKKSIDSESSDVKPKPGYPKAVLFIIGNEFCERFSYYGMKAILVLYFKNVLSYSEDESTEYYHIFAMACYFTPVLGAIIADSLLGKFRTIFYISILYAIGNIVLSYAAYQTNAIISWIGLIAIALGTGGIKPCVSAFGGDQFGPGQEAQLQKFFSFFYISINAGSLLSTFITPILREDVQCFHRLDCFPLAFGVPAILMIIALCTFVLGKFITHYVMVPPSKGNIVVTTVKCVFVALRRKICSSGLKKEHWLDYSDDMCDKKTLDEIKAVMRILFLYLPLPIFWALFDQQGSRWTLQATKMDGNFFGIYRLKPDQIQVVNPLLIISLIPVFEYVIYPLFAKLDILKKPLQRMTTGGILAATAFVICGFFQLKVESEMPTVLIEDSAHFAIVNGLNTTIKFSNTKLGNEPELLNPYGVMMYENVALKDWNQDTRLQIEISGNAVDGCVTGQPYEVPANRVVKDGVIVFITESICLNESQTISMYDFPNILTKPKEGGSYVGLVFNIKNYDIEDNNASFSFKNKEFEKFLLPNSTVEDFNGSSTGFADYKEIDIHKGGDYSLRLLNRKDNRQVDITGKLDFEQGGSYLLIVYGDNQNLTFKTHELVKPNAISMFCQIIQYAVITCGEIMFSITGLEFSYSQAPKSMKSVLQAAWLMTVAFGNLIVVIIATAKIFDKQSLEFFFFAALMVLDMFVFAIMAYFYVPYKAPEVVEDSGEREKIKSGKNENPNVKDNTNGSTNGKAGVANEAFNEEDTKF